MLRKHKKKHIILQVCRGQVLGAECNSIQSNNCICYLGFLVGPGMHCMLHILLYFLTFLLERFTSFSESVAFSLDHIFSIWETNMSFLAPFYSSE
jgi:hypothetical protein